PPGGGHATGALGLANGEAGGHQRRRPLADRAVVARPRFFEGREVGAASGLARPFRPDGALPRGSGDAPGGVMSGRKPLAISDLGSAISIGHPRSSSAWPAAHPWSSAGR